MTFAKQAAAVRAVREETGCSSRWAWIALERRDFDVACAIEYLENVNTLGDDATRYPLWTARKAGSVSEKEPT